MSPMVISRIHRSTAERLARAMARLAVLAAVVLVTGCHPTEIWVVVDSNLAAARQDPAGLQIVRIETYIDGEATPFWTDSNDLRSADRALPGYKQVRAQHNPETRRLRVVATGRLADGTEVRQTALASFGQGRRLRLDMFLARECLGARQAECEAMPGMTCGAGGTCVPIDRPSLPEFAGVMDAAAAADADADASAGSDGGLGACPVADAPATSPGVPAPRLVGPTSGAVVTTRRPTFRWQLGTGSTGGRVELCREPTCTTVAARFEATGSSVRAECDLPVGTVFFRVRAINGTSYGADVSPVWQLRVPTNDTGADAIDRIDADFDGDGLSDAVLQAGTSLYLIAGVRGGAPQARSTALYTGLTGTGLGLVVAGDLDGNGVVDLAIGGPSLRLLYLARGAAPVLSTVPAPGTSTDFGAKVAPAGDVDADGYADLVAGAPTTTTAMNSNGAAFLVLGSAGVVTPVAIGMGPGNRTLEMYGNVVAGVGDATGDGRSDCAVGAPGENVNNGAVYLWGAPAGTPTSVARMLPGGVVATTNARVGQTVIVLGDLTGDGRADLLVPSNAGMFFAQGGGSGFGLLGRATGLDGAPSLVGDFDGVLGDEVALFEAGATYPNGSIAILRGGATRTVGDRFTGTMTQPVTASVAATGDFDGDGLSDLLVVSDPATRTLLFFRGGVSPLSPAVVTVGAAGAAGALSSGS